MKSLYTCRICGANLLYGRTTCNLHCPKRPKPYTDFGLPTDDMGLGRLSNKTVSQLKKRQKRMVAKGEECEETGHQVLWVFDDIEGKDLVLGYRVKPPVKVA